jgi:acyl carrier protein
MDATQVLEQVNDVFRDVLDEDVTVARETTANDVEEWDSLTHIQLVVAVEKRFKIKFTTAEIQGFQNVGEMCDAIAAKVR